MNADSPDPVPDAQLFVTLRFARIRLRGTFTTREAGLGPGDWVLARTVRGVEHAQVLSRPRTVAAASRMADPEETQVVGEVMEPLGPHEALPPWGMSGRFTREFEVAASMIAEMGLPMRLTDVETLPRRDKAIFYFLADGRVDFRQLVRNLARILRIRVEMKQIGVRDEARLKGSCGHCGLDLCCARWIRRMAPVNMKMAKTQKTTLDPDKISGRCGRLLCCLRFEEQVYADNRNRLPLRNALVRTPVGTGRVVGQDLLRCQVRVALEGGEVKAFPLEEVVSIGDDVPGDAGIDRPCEEAPLEGAPTGCPERLALAEECPDPNPPAEQGEAVPDEQEKPRKARRKRRKGPRSR